MNKNFPFIAAIAGGLMLAGCGLNQDPAIRLSLNVHYPQPSKQSLQKISASGHTCRVAIVDLTAFADITEFQNAEAHRCFQDASLDVCSWDQVISCLSQCFTVVTNQSLDVKNGVMEGTVNAVAGLNGIYVAVVDNGEITWIGRQVLLAVPDSVTQADVWLNQNQGCPVTGGAAGAVTLYQPTVNNGIVSLNWSQASATGFMEYMVYRGTAPGVTDQSGTLVTASYTVGENYATDNTITVSGTYYYKIYSYYQIDGMIPSNEVSVQVTIGASTQWTTYTGTQGLPANMIYSVASDPVAGGTWIGTEQGLSYYDNISFTNYTTINSLISDNIVMCIEVDAQGIVWAGTYSGVSIFNGAAWSSFDTVPGGPGQQTINDIAIDPNGTKWFATTFGVYSYDGTAWEHYNLPGDPLPSNSVQALAIDQTGKLWVGCDVGVGTFEDSVWSTFTPPSSLAGTNIQAICHDALGNIWIGTQTGLSRFDGVSIVNYDTSNGMAGNPVSSIAADPVTGGMWVGGFYGLSNFIAGTWTAFTAGTSGLVDDRIYDLSVTQTGTVWAATFGGVSRYVP